MNLRLLSASLAFATTLPVAIITGSAVSRAAPASPPTVSAPVTGGK